MCGRFVAATPPDQIASYFGAEPVTETLADEAWAADYNVAPTDTVYTVRVDGSVRRLDPMRWGLVPFWAKDLKVGARMINARAETLAEKSAFRRPLEKRRCLVPADGFYEWQKIDGQKAKQPMYIHRADDEPLAFAGLWEVWRNPDEPDGERLHSCTIITTTANGTMSPVHDRMPVILPPTTWDTWLDPDLSDVETLGRLLVPAPDSLLALHPVSAEVNNVQHDGPTLIDRADPIAGQGTLL